MIKKERNLALMLKGFTPPLMNLAQRKDIL